ncbi:MAG: hypothetical protein ACFB15_20540 [Cyclobacteriaceae bacterium]
MEDEEIYRKAKIVGISGMTVNERLWASGLDQAFDRAKRNNKPLARKILQALKVDRASIDKVIK